MREKLTKVQLKALEECAAWAARRAPYWWRRASMAKLASMGLVERVPHPELPRLDSYVPTQKGRDLLSGFPPDAGRALLQSEDGR